MIDPLEKPAADQPRTEDNGTRTEAPHKRRSRKCRNKTAAPEPGPDMTLPYWLSRGPLWAKIPEDLRQAVLDVLVPAYRQLVVDAPTPLERSVGITLAHLMWLEMAEQVRMATTVADPMAFLSDPSAILDLTKPAELVTRHMGLVATKCQTAELLMKIRAFAEVVKSRQEAMARQAAALPAPAFVPFDPAQVEGLDDEERLL